MKILKLELRAIGSPSTVVLLPTEVLRRLKVKKG